MTEDALVEEKESGLSNPSPQADPPPQNWVLQLSLAHFEGPIDLLLALARTHKIDLTHIQILPLAEQYLNFIARAKEAHLEIAADYLVMAAWLSQLKSLLLLPKPPEPVEEDALDALEIAQRFALHLQRLEAMQKAAKDLQALPQLGQDFFASCLPEQFSIAQHAQFEVDYYELLSAYGDVYDRKKRAVPLRIAPTRLQSVEAALARLSRLIGDVGDWCDLNEFLAEFKDESDPLVLKSHLVANMVACLELARDKRLHIKQNYAFSPIMVKRYESKEA